jgi:hypothetical protein
VQGSKIRVAGEDSEVGVYFNNLETQTRTKVEVSDIVRNNPSEVEVIIPSLPADEYNLEIVTQFSGLNQSPLKSPRSTTFNKVLTVS